MTIYFIDGTNMNNPEPMTPKRFSKIIEEIVIDELPEIFSACNIKDLEIRQQTGCTVIGYVCEKGELTVNPAPDFKVAPHSKLYILGNDTQIEKFHNWFTEKTR